MLPVILISLLVGSIVAYYLKKRDDKAATWPEKIYEIFNSKLTNEEKDKAVQKLLK